VTLGKVVTATGAVTPSTVIGSRVTLTVQMKKGATWVKVKTTSTSSRPAGKYRWKHTPAERGTYRMRATVPKDDVHAAVATQWLIFTVK